jgi:aryl-alcohol dehydrogenase-like predicted oxidoreductase
MTKPPTTIPSRRVGASALEVSELGLGCNRIGENILSDAEWIALIHRAIDLGVTTFDTAAQYTGGRSEELIGRALGNHQNVVIATKVSGKKEGKHSSFSKEAVMAGAEKSLRVLRRDVIDIFQTHGSGALDEVSDPEWAEAMVLLKEQGKIRLRGSAVFDSEGGLFAIEHDLADVLQVTYNLLDRGHVLPILPAAAAHGVGLLARMPYQRGILTGKFSESSADVSGHRASLQGDRLENDIRATEKFRQIGSGRATGLPALAMQYVLAETRLSCTIPGARSIAQLEDNVSAAHAPRLTEAEARAIEDLQKAEHI